MVASSALTTRRVQQLTEAYRSYISGADRAKLKLIRTLKRSTKFSPKSLLQYHDILLFLEAFPDTHTIYKLAVAELKRIARLTPYLLRRNRSFGRNLIDTGITGTTARITPALPATKWLLAHFGDNLTLDFDEDYDFGKLDNVLRDITQSPLSDAVLFEQLTTLDLLQKLSASNEISAKWLSDVLSSNSDDDVLSEHGYNGLNFAFNWKLDANASRTLLRLGKRRPYIHADGLLKNVKVHAEISKPLRPPKRLGIAATIKLLDGVKAILYQLGRETDSTNYASAADTFLFELDRGIEIVLIGTVPSRRRHLESFIGFIATKNSVPCAYGGAWIFGSKADIGVNIFEPFRGGESAFLFSQILRAYHQFFEVQTFEVEPYQFGQDNDEGVKSGAFWFYWKMGFRSVNKTLNVLAKRELGKISKGRYKSSQKTLARMCDAKLKFRVSEKHLIELAPVQEISAAICARVGKRYKGDMQRAQALSLAKIKKDLNIKDLWSNDELRALKRFSLLLDLIPKISKLSSKDKATLVELIKAKAGPSERKFILGVKECAPLVKLLSDFYPHGLSA